MSGYLLDTWAWIEFYEGSNLGEIIYELLKSEEDIYISAVSLAELSDKYHEGALNSDHNWKEIQVYIESQSTILNLDHEICTKAGKIKQDERETQPDFGLMDAIILSTAKENDLKLISGDSHLEDKKITANLEKIKEI